MSVVLPCFCCRWQMLPLLLAAAMLLSDRVCESIVVPKDFGGDRDSLTDCSDSTAGNASTNVCCYIYYLSLSSTHHIITTSQSWLIWAMSVSIWLPPCYDSHLPRSCLMLPHRCHYCCCNVHSCCQSYYFKQFHQMQNCLKFICTWLLVELHAADSMVCFVCPSRSVWAYDWQCPWKWQYQSHWRLCCQRIGSNN